MNNLAESVVPAKGHGVEPPAGARKTGRRPKLSRAEQAAIVEAVESMQTYGVCSGLRRFWAHGTRMSRWRKW